MATVNSAELNLSIRADLSGSADPGGAAVYRPELEAILQFTGGTTANKADLAWFDERSVNASSNDDIDLAGVLSDAFGQTITAAEMVLFAIKNKSTSQTLTIGGGTNPWISWLIATGDGIKIPPSGVFCLAAPDAAGLGAVVAATGDILRVANGAGSAATYEIIVLARTVA